MFRGPAFCVVLLSAFAAPLLAANPSRGEFDEEITIFGAREQQKQVTGAAHRVGPADIQRFKYSDIQRISRQIPGVSVQIEDGYGLRPNISIRGVATDRSARITLLEDNVLIAPAPYAAPSAYYFPTVGRLHAFEVLKGPAAITQGPHTIGGALNMISTPIPSESRAHALVEIAEDATYRVHAHYGNQADNGWGFLLETHQWLSDGFQTIDRSNRDTGLKIADYTAKLRYAPVGSAHRVELKLQYADQLSNQSYLGLADADFAASPLRRYGLAALDAINTEHEQVILRYDYEIKPGFSLSATAYNNEHMRDWFKTEGIDFNGSTNAQEFSRTSWFDVIQAVNRNQSLQGLSAIQLQQILSGEAETLPGSIQLRSNARSYYSRGVQLNLDWDGQVGATDHALEIGLRLHSDAEDRLQRNSTYRQADGVLRLDDPGLWGNAGNQIQKARALAVHVHDRIQFGNLTLTPGLRFERIEQQRTRFETGTGDTLNPAARTPDNFRDYRQNTTSVLLPGAGFIYQLNEPWSILGGVHKGFSAPGNAPDVREEQALNYEFGFRYQGMPVTAELIGFFSDYDNLLGVCTASSGADCEIGSAFNGDAATVQGIEASLSLDLAPGAGFTMPLEIAYTYTDARFDTNIADTDFFGDVSAGDPIPYIPEQQMFISLGLMRNDWSVYLAANYLHGVCTRAACGEFDRTDDSFTVDMSGEWFLSDRTSVYARVENLTNANAIVGRQPYGARPNKDRTMTLGLTLDF